MPSGANLADLAAVFGDEEIALIVDRDRGGLDDGSVGRETSIAGPKLDSVARVGMDDSIGRDSKDDRVVGVRDVEIAVEIRGHVESANASDGRILCGSAIAGEEPIRAGDGGDDALRG